MAKVLVVDDEPQLLRALRINLTARGHEVITATDGAGALRAVSQAAPDAVVLDLGLPDMDGVQVIEGVRGWTDVPVLVLSARTESTDKVHALDAGADDYVAKPFRLAELMARIRALLRRGAPETLEASGVRLDLTARRVLVDEHEVQLANKEFELLRVLMQHAGQVVTREEILEEVWPESDRKGSKTLDMHISWLRRKLGDSNGRLDETRIATVRGVGFRFNAD